MFTLWLECWKKFESRGFQFNFQKNLLNENLLNDLIFKSCNETEKPHGECNEKLYQEQDESSASNHKKTRMRKFKFSIQKRVGGKIFAAFIDFVFSGCLNGRPAANEVWACILMVL